ncbi:tetratricopeptide repeat protein [Pontibacter roseus]|uniref:tetratricopeptide repeat protein n=1 Tax=Pontibacter roseus TaxID=336989 RepID=UPI000379BF18|nr:tetratricopeptide repeat protein [Pontibacter roseus]
MNKSAFIKLIQQVSNISDQQTEELEKVAEAFPYCQTAHLLLAKSAFDKGSMLSTQRLRRASSYATDRQLLKRVIYTSPSPEPVFEEAEAPEKADEQVALPESTPVEEAIITADVPEAEAIPQEDLNEVYAVGIAAEMQQDASENATAEEAQAEEMLDSELALLFTFNSISSSSTDLLSHREEAEAIPVSNHYSETDEALAEVDAYEAVDEPQEEELHVTEVEVTEVATPSDELSEEPANADESDFEPEISQDNGLAQQPDFTDDPEDAEINYTTDEIDRLYAEDSLGYWMGSSRMGEVLQLKDDYTRQRPQSFHPELILEYSKTHELEKAIQPSKHVLSQQLDIIDQFLKLNPRLKTMANMKLKPEPQEDLSLKSSKIKKGMASENLANIFLKQGKTKKALKIYEQLILKYPEKKSYFAQQIEKLQNIT